MIEYEEDDYPVKWTGDDGQTHNMTLEGAADELKRLFDEFPDGMNELESHMEWHNKLYNFFDLVLSYGAAVRRQDVDEAERWLREILQREAEGLVQRITPENRHGEAWPNGPSAGVHEVDARSLAEDLYHIAMYGDRGNANKLMDAIEAELHKHGIGAALPDGGGQ